MAISWLLQRVVELVATYLVHSTLLLGGLALVVLLVLSWRLGGRKTFAGRSIVNPALTERLWKLAAVLPLVTTAFSVFAGWSKPLLEWSVATGERRLNPLNDFSAEVRAEVDGRIVDFASTNPADVDADLMSSEELLAASVFSPTGIDGIIPMERDGPANSIVLNNVPGEHRAILESVTESSQPGHEIDPNDSRSSASTAIGEELLSVDDSPIKPPASEASSSWVAYIGILFLAWIVLSALRLMGRAILVHRYVSKCRPVIGDLRSQLDRLMSGRSIRLLYAVPQKDCALALEPFACGLWNWTIVLPEEIERQLSPAELNGLLAHEVAHLVRRDPWWQCLGEWLCTCLAFQPLNFLARRHWQQSAELLCDDWAVRRHVSAISLASCLTRIAELRLDRRGRMLGLAAVGQPGSLSHRIEWLLRTERTTETRSRVPMAGTALAFVLGILIGGFGPRLTLSLPVEAASDLESPSKSDPATDFLRAEINRELAATLKELQDVQTLLPADSTPEIAATAKRLREHAWSIRARLDQ